MPFPPADAPLGAVYPPPKRPPFPLLMGPGFLPLFDPPAAGDWAALQALAARHDWRLPPRWRRELRQRPGLALVLTDLTQRICWVNDGFTALSGYSAAEALGRHPGFLQGAGTAERTRAAIRQRLQQARPFVGPVLNYRRDGQPYSCHVHIRPVRNAAGLLTHFLAFEHEILPPPTTS